MYLNLQSVQMNTISYPWNIFLKKSPLCNRRLEIMLTLHLKEIETYITSKQVTCVTSKQVGYFYLGLSCTVYL